MKNMRYEISKKKSFLDKMDIIKQYCSGKDFLVIGCGPSLKDYKKETIQNFSKDKNVLCIKQSYLEFSNICNFHFFNDFNVSHYKHGEEVFTCSSSRMNYEDTKKKVWKNFRDTDIHFIINELDFYKTLAVKNNFQDWEIEKTGINRIWGPGIILECVFPFLSYIRPKNIYTLGWDLAPRDINGGTHFEHYYNNTERDNFVNASRVCHEYENIKSIENSQFLNKYLESLDIKLIVLSKQSHVHEEIRRIEIE